VGAWSIRRAPRRHGPRHPARPRADLTSGDARRADRLGVYTLISSQIDAFVATASIRFEVLAIDRASLTLITGMTEAMAMTPDGRVVVSGTMGPGWTAIRSARHPADGHHGVEYIGNFEAARDVSDDGSSWSVRCGTRDQQAMARSGTSSLSSGKGLGAVPGDHCEVK